MNKNKWTKSVKNLPANYNSYANLPTDKPIHFTMERQPDNGEFTITSPEIPELITQGGTPYEALRNAVEALKLVDYFHANKEEIVNLTRRSTGRGRSGGRGIRD